VTTTRTDTTAETSIHDDVVRLREWGSGRIHTLPLSGEDSLIGTSDGCWCKLNDERISRRHALLRRIDGHWWIVDFASKNGVREDGQHRAEPFVLQPGAEIGIGGVTLVVESGRTIALREFCSRIIGWTSDRATAVDGALRSIRLAARLRTGLSLCGPPSLVPIAHAIHRYTHGTDRPFVVCDPRRRDSEETVRSAANQELGLVALEAAAGGSMCVQRAYLPRDFDAVQARIREQDTRVQLIVCSRKPDRAAVVVPVEVPPLKARPSEVPRVIEEYVLDATTMLNAPQTILTRSDRSWILEHASSTLHEIEKAAQRLVGLRLSDTISGAAALLGLAPVSLTRWIDRRRPPLRGRPGRDADQPVPQS
jgi:hypothetical protein